jgi:ubiquinone biosynthesis monooxygenase Coq7
MLDRMIIRFDRALRTILPEFPQQPSKLSPDAKVPSEQLSSVETHQSQAMMRVNLAGEVAAQGLYRGQLLVARDPDLKAKLMDAAQEEFDHYIWCIERLKGLNASPSLLNPLWYIGALSIGLLAAIWSDKVSLGFIIATEEQVGLHLASHLLRLPERDKKSIAIVRQMYVDELQHAEDAEHLGGVRLPMLLQIMMHGMAQVMINCSRLI